jgi:hypothetical protein
MERTATWRRSARDCPARSSDSKRLHNVPDNAPSQKSTESHRLRHNFSRSTRTTDRRPHRRIAPRPLEHQGR